MLSTNTNFARGKKFAIYIPTLNGAKTLPSVFQRIPPHVREEAAEILVVDNCSPDNSYRVAEEWAKTHNWSNMKAYRMAKNLGYGGSQKFAHQHCIDAGYDVVVMLHGDAQYAPEELPRLLEPMLKGEAEMLFGSRITGHPLKGGMPLHRFIGNKFLTTSANLVLGWNLSEYHSGYRLFSTAGLKQIPFQRCSDDFHFDSEILIQYKLKNLRVMELTIPTFYGDEKCYINVWKYGIDILLVLWRYFLHTKNIRREAVFDVGEPLRSPGVQSNL